jgi:hypothetical protein
MVRRVPPKRPLSQVFRNCHAAAPSVSFPPFAISNQERQWPARPGGQQISNFDYGSRFGFQGRSEADATGVGFHLYTLKIHANSVAYNLNTKIAQSSGPENIDLERPLSVHLAQVPVHSPSRITLENKEKIRPQPDRENAFARASGGGDGPDVEPSLPSNPLNINGLATSFRPRKRLASMPRSCSRSATFRCKSGTSTYIITARRMIPWLILR